MPDPLAETRIITAAIDLFGRSGLDAVGTRAIAEAAGTQMSAITYHFGSKEGLYLACAKHIAQIMRAKTAPLVDQLTPGCSAREARTQIESLLSGMTLIMMRDDIADIARFAVREQMNPTAAFDVLYEGAMRHVLEPLGALLGTIAGSKLNAEELQVRCFSLLGQVLAFRFCHATLMRTTRWKRVGANETEIARQAVLANARAIFTDLARR